VCRRELEQTLGVVTSTRVTRLGENFAIWLLLLTTFYIFTQIGSSKI
jgi:hypothetical protein